MVLMVLVAALATASPVASLLAAAESAGIVAVRATSARHALRGLIHQKGRNRLQRTQGNTISEQLRLQDRPKEPGRWGTLSILV